MTNIILEGNGASPGIAIGKVYLLDEDRIELEEKRLQESEIELEIKKFELAIQSTLDDLRLLKRKVMENVGSAQAEIFDAHIMMLQDKVILNQVIEEVRGQGINAEVVFYRIMRKNQDILLSTKDEYLKERAADIKDVKRRVIRKMQGISGIKPFQLRYPVLIASFELTPTLTATLDRSKILGFVTELGSRTSHAAILARALEVPAVVGVNNLCSYVRAGETVIIDGTEGQVIINPSTEQIKQFEKQQEGFTLLGKRLSTIADLPAVTEDGRKVDISANIELPEEVNSVLTNGANGIGLYRTEYLFMLQNKAPEEDEQTEEYLQIAKKIYPAPLIIRTIDIGGDKLSGLLVAPREENPFLGWRGIRACFDNPDIFRTQLRAILRASVSGNVHLMFPMISGYEELMKAKEHLEYTKSELYQKGIPFNTDIKIGIMIEIPSAVLVAEQLADEVDFFSIGTNDLIQYALAVDRSNVRVSNLYQFFHPSVLKLIKLTIDAGHNKNIWVGMCGEMAGDPLATLLLLGMNLDEFSVSPLIVPEIKEIIRSVTYEDAKVVSQKCMKMETSEEIEKYLSSLVKEKFPDIPV